jgi:phosphoesterase RecJ-like protein
MQQLENFKAYLAEPRRVVIFPHRKPDADALGSCLALSRLLIKLGHTVHVVSPTDYPKFLFWMPGNDKVLNFENKAHVEQATALIEQADLLCCLDFSSLNRIDKLGELVSKSNAKKLLVDHHQGKQDFADFELWDTSAAATAELIYDLIVQMGYKHLIDEPIAACLYAGIMTDTGSFKFASTSSKIHRIVAELKDMGLNSTRIHHLVYDANTLERLQFLGFALHEKLKVLPRYKFAYIAIAEEEQKRFHSQTGDTEGLVNYALSLEGVVFAAMLTEKKDHVKISFRSAGNFSVADLATKYFNGGGHHNAAGGIVYQRLEEVVDTLINVLPEYEKELNAPNVLKG